MNWTWLPLIVLGAMLIVLFVHAVFPIGRSRPRNERSAYGRSPAPLYREDDRFWIAGMLYYNPHDPDLFVPKRLGFGRTVNIGRPLGKVILFGPLLLPIALAILQALSRR